jgi:hypothetical protein
VRADAGAEAAAIKATTVRDKNRAFFNMRSVWFCVLPRTVQGDFSILVMIALLPLARGTWEAVPRKLYRIDHLFPFYYSFASLSMIGVTFSLVDERFA